jgi:putative exosortase-associated protein (TIGR04073 family)
MRKTLVFVIGLSVILLLTANVYAQSEAVSPLTNLGTYQVRSLHPEKDTSMFTSDYLKSVNEENAADEDSPANKMGVGMINAATSWTDVPRQVAEVSEKDNALAGWTLGFGEGVLSGIARGVSGAFDMATCGLPPYNKPLMEPEYKVRQPDQGFKIDLFRW